jgi:thiosulfate dehydrogenase [quinone] large subunit
MPNYKQISLLVLRVSTGWLMFYAGFVKVLNPNWSAAGYLEGAKTFTFFYHWLLQPEILPIINFINEWGLVLLGISLLFGVFVRFSAIFGALLMMLYYFPVLSFPYAGYYGFIVDEHIIYAVVLIFLGAARSGEFWGLDKYLQKLFKV